MGSLFSTPELNQEYDDPKQREYYEAFSLFDQNGDGTISVEELATLVRCLGQNPTESELQDMKNEMDQDNSGYVDKQEFVQWMSQRRNNSDVEVELLEAFNVFDKDGDGRFPAAALEHIMRSLSRKLTPDEVEEMVLVADAEGTGQIKYEEFIKTMITK
uniref:Calmodulin IV n=1 Tax=Euglena gracilis TaxID=3039 RepID=C0L9G8_EUGGR|nr:calmodulin IV [Euglena gracilis]